jgi:hypothetical protein
MLRWKPAMRKISQDYPAYPGIVLGRIACMSSTLPFGRCASPRYLFILSSNVYDLIQDVAPLSVIRRFTLSSPSSQIRNNV